MASKTARKLMIYVLGTAFILCNLFLFVNTSVAAVDSVRDEYYGIKSEVWKVLKKQNLMNRNKANHLPRGRKPKAR